MTSPPEHTREGLGLRSAARGAGRAATGFALFFEAMGLLRRERRLWAFAAAPIALTVTLLAIAFGLLVEYAGPLHALATDWMPVLTAEGWVEWLWVGPARVGLALLGYLLFALGAAFGLAFTFMLANVLAAPFLDELSRRVERIECGQVLESDSNGLAALLRESGRAIWTEGQRLLFFTAVWLTLFAAGIVIPGGQLLAPPAMLAFTIWFLPLDYCSYVLDRRQLPFRARRQWIRANLATMLGFGSAAFVTLLVPGLNFLMLPVLVVAGTQLALRRLPPVA